MSKKLLVMAGGTGGHVFPALAVASKLQQQGWQIRWLGTADRMEAQLVPQHGIEIDFIEIKGLRGQKLLRLIKAPFQIVKAIGQAKRHIRAYQPDAVLGMGGYVSGPGGIAAWLCGVPVILHEQNAVAGLTNRWLSRIAKVVLQAFPGAFANRPVVGNPVRDEIAALPGQAAAIAERDEPIRVLVMGGSQGAQILNRVVPQAVAQSGQSLQVWHQAGKNNQASTEQAYQDAGITNAKVTEFIADVAGAYQWADLIVCRSGALTVSELSCAGLGAIFVPFMHKDEQQAKNARHLVEAGAAELIYQKDLTAEKLAARLQQLDRSALVAMAEKAKACAIDNAAERVANAIIDQAK
ncbi:UDP-N-acetylglucosamine--N-acetylmuramyl-(pentapeptide) pyrophosphoryl-undecaprenol N-acetylglucosamine transferase [Vibrio stylophorae]|uniref:UDP-N-acetylglucosamine--N-acetylmuramyl-(pentapeptide) pyrophosphoryl-undecaprenol N-acetylglucosamine transferase n=1 Tax=Vibrio stylophorae TaxID=659351 RepID=A0ABM8ZVT2_9VIBR|nr:undecaprenyldiphospho-muramoylpentapeptide beta-N-acetylglucosaminyltransferase [Vibrio stylophorae]CAH0534449.1 UDP-N-acetylglucosamine--N-acetylmuramyl-(pentapeptide) pyrophosphoryl-undecaprenol N-acetylglucosamine transferase [Vibrio stylophorae]